MTFDPFICDPQVDDVYIPTEEDWESIHDSSDDGYALASAGLGTDEDYGGACDY